MQVSKAPPPDLPTGRAATSPNADQGAQTAVSSIAVDRADIRPLDAQAALQILIAEARASLDALLLSALGPRAAPAPVATPPLNPSQAAQQLVELFLRSVPLGPADAQPQDVALTSSEARLPIQQAPSDAHAWLEVAAQVQDALGGGVDAALRTISAWRNVPPPVIDVAHETRIMLQAALIEEPPNPVWLRPEWLGLAPRMQRFWRRRRQMRRRLTDPDYPSRQLDDDTERDQ